MYDQQKFQEDSLFFLYLKLDFIDKVFRKLGVCYTAALDIYAYTKCVLMSC